MKKALKIKFKKSTALLLSLALSVGQFPVLPREVIDVQAQESTGNKLSVTAFATKDELMTVFEADGTNETIGKVVFGKDSEGSPLEWYVLGRDRGVEGENIAIFAASVIAKDQVFDNESDNKTYESSFGTYESSPTEVYPNHYGASDLRVALQEMAVNQDYFTASEQSMMQATTITTNDTMNSVSYTTTDILYALKGDDTNKYELWAGSGDGKILSWKNYWLNGTEFWLRSPYTGKDFGISNTGIGDYTLSAYDRLIRGCYVKISNLGLRPASNLNLTSVLFASAAAVTTSGTVAKGELAEETAMTLRIDGSNKDIGSVTYDSTQGVVLAKKSETALDTVSVVIQGNDGGKDWYYSKAIKDKVLIKTSDLKAGLGLSSDITLSECKVWIETTVDNVSFAKFATEGMIASEELLDVDSNDLSVTVFATKDELMNNFVADGTNTTIGKITFGKDSDRNPLEWYVLGKDSGIEGENTAIFAATPIVHSQVFEDNSSDRKTYESSFGTYESNPTEVNPNHYGASDLRVALQEMAVNQDYFTASEQSIMQATTITSDDTLNRATYTTTDVLYAVKGEGYGTKLWVGSGDEKILLMKNYWRRGSGFWQRKDTSNYYVVDIVTPDVGSSGVWVNNVHAVRPASNLNLTSVIFASAATSATFGTVPYGEFVEETALCLRMDGSNIDIGSVTCDSDQGIVLANKSETATGTVSVVIQGNDGFKDWYYSKVIKDKVLIKSSDLKVGLGLVSDIELSECKVWIETTMDNVSYAKLATEERISSEELSDANSNYSSYTTFVTKDELMNNFVADGTNTTLGKITFGKDCDRNPLEWYVLGKDRGIEGDNTAIFVSSPIAKDQIFEDDASDKKTYKVSFGRYETNPSEVYVNHYGASDLRVALQEMAENEDYFTATEQSIMQATTVTTYDTMNSTLYTTTDVLYAVQGEYNEDYVLWAGSGDEKILPMKNCWQNGNWFWLRSPYNYIDDYIIVTDPGYYVRGQNVGNAHAVYPASNLNLTSVVFASAVAATTSEIVKYGELAERTTMILRMDGDNIDIGSVSYDSAQKTVLAKKSETAIGKVSMVIQGNDGFRDWYYSKLVTDSKRIEISDIKKELGLQYDVKLSDCKVWIETTVDNVCYAKMATEEMITEEVTTEQKTFEETTTEKLEEESSAEVGSNEMKGSYNIEETNVLITQPGKYEIFGNGNATTNRIDIMADGVVELTIRDINIVASEPVRIENGDVILILSGVNTLDSQKGSAIFAGENPLIIEGSGYLKAISPLDSSKSGSGIYTKDIMINSGTIEAYAGMFNCAIGASEVKRIIINGGNIKACANTGEKDAAFSGSSGIGSSENCGEIIITGGTIEAYGGNGPGIGGKEYTKSIKITGGNVIAHGGYSSAGIGTGCKDFFSKIDSILITGGNITAYGAEHIDDLYMAGAGIGGGIHAAVGIIRIVDGKINATGSEHGAGIGTGMNGTCERIEISGGIINATAGKYAAAIGLGSYDAVIGDGYIDSYLGELLITGGIITANAFAYASVGIGANELCDGNLKKIQITGGTITCNSYELWDDIACEGAEKIIVTGGNIQAEKVLHPIVDEMGKALVKSDIYVGKDYKDYNVTEISYANYNLNDVKVNADGYVIVYVPENEVVKVCVDDKWFTNNPIYEVGINVKFGQTEAREMLELVNQFRTSKDVWYWNEDNKTKIICNGLSELVYDYQLEAAAMQRAAEIALYYSHTRPNQESFFKVYNDLGYSYVIVAENIAAGYQTGEAVFEGWKEENEDYAGQGHRRNMLGSEFNAIGIGHVYYNGYHYWVQQLGTASSEPATPANDSEAYMKVKVADFEITQLSLSKEKIILHCGEELSVLESKVKLKLKETWPGDTCEVETDIGWKMVENECIKYENGKVVGLKIGTALLTATVMGRQINLEIMVVHNPKMIFQEGTSNQAGVIQEVCSGCGTVISETIATIKTVTLSGSDYVYTGTAIEPGIIVRDKRGVVVSDDDYTVTYKNNIDPGIASVIVTGIGNYTGTIIETFNIKLSKLKNLKQSINYDTSKITMTWDAVEGADGYEIYRGTTSNGKYEYLDSVTTNTFTNTDLKVASKYYYKVRAYKNINDEMIYGAYSEARGFLTTPETPEGFEVTLKSRTAQISWTEVTGAQGYEIYRAKSPNDKYSSIKSVGAGKTSYKDTGLSKGNKYYYKIRAFVKNGSGDKIYSEYSTIKEVQLKKDITEVTLSVSAYNYDGTSKKPTVTVEAAYESLTMGKDYIVTYKNNTNPGTASVVVNGIGDYTGTITKTFKINLPRVANFKQNTTYTTNKIAMKWNVVKGADGYSIYRSTSKNGSYKYLKTVKTNTATHAGLKAGSKYYYKVRAYKTVNGKKVYGAYSETKSMFTKPGAPTNFAVTLKSRTAKISWVKSTGAQGYEVYMSNSRNGSYIRIKNAAASITAYNKTGLVKGKKYYFKMRAYTKTGTGVKVYSGYSKIKAITVK